jgi:hypothetical protein
MASIASKPERGHPGCRRVADVIVEALELTPDEFARATGWEIKPEGACKEERCVPLPDGARRADGRVDARAVAEHIGMPVVAEEAHHVWAIGPQAEGRVLDSTHLPRIVLPDFQGRPFDLASLRGQKVVIIAWGSY